MYETVGSFSDRLVTTSVMAIKQMLEFTAHSLNERSRQQTEDMDELDMVDIDNDAIKKILVAPEIH